VKGASVVELVYLGPSDVLHLEEDGPAYHPGDVVKLNDEQIGILTRMGQRFAHVHPDPEPDPEPVPARATARSSKESD
jgi:hypothetical protein